jgi:plasmid stabilization system protein ParE
MTASVSSEADRELTEGPVYYAREGARELGLAFVAEFERTVSLLCEHPTIGTVWRASRRRFPLRRFPYRVIYYIHGDEIRVIAMTHH